MEGILSQMAREMGMPTVERNRKLERAQQLMYRAWEETNPAKRLALAHDALSASPDCADAYVLLAEDEAPTVEKAMEYYRQGVEAGERALGHDYFAKSEGHFWSLLETRPYMRARLGLARALWQVQKTGEAITHFREMLRLNPGDNQGVRYLLLDLLMHLERDADVGALLEQYADDAMALWLYSRALHAFRTAGASERANALLREALKENPHVPAYLTGEKRIPTRRPPTMGFGDEAEAIAYAADHLPHWRCTAGALDWLKTQMAREPAGQRKRTARKSARKH
jgi:tetratricopeptide (TPR) repeat protein